MIDVQKELRLLIEDPLFQNIKIPAPALTADDRMIEKMQAINAFYEKYGKEPSSEGAFEEKRLARSLAALRNENCAALKPMDIYNLL